ncbi:Phosphoadenosine phosphosulfate reductase [Desulfonema limicola]|uniref:Phosphoadenosine phosphosulfate reductase n=1 Tax=Desulfonema limicola TaxID=45656 RepID=A0A975B4Z8_9BACT|nr:phosphoadenosine phosphosulfate reductase family protein [Desulfonema limicola]QTA78901.1 Phosphoadenosine phosphosulfate reductase [Desulfonema limicola]
MDKRDQHTINTKKYLESLYFADERPWVVAFSGGKDSTLLLQLVYEMLSDLKDKAHKNIFVVSTDTCIEPPNISQYLHKTLSIVEEQAKTDLLPLKVIIVQPKPEESFWGNLIGKGYPSPTRWFRWCTSHIKIRPSRRIILEIIHEFGSVILLLGTRKSESRERKKRMDKRDYSTRGLNSHECNQNRTYIII